MLPLLGLLVGIVSALFLGRALAPRFRPHLACAKPRLPATDELEFHDKN